MGSDGMLHFIVCDKTAKKILILIAFDEGKATEHSYIGTIGGENIGTGFIQTVKQDSGIPRSLMGA